MFMFVYLFILQLKREKRKRHVRKHALEEEEDNTSIEAVSSKKGKNIEPDEGLDEFQLEGLYIIYYLTLYIYICV